MQSLDDVLADMDMKSIVFLRMALQECAYGEATEYADPEYALVSEQVSEALWKIASLVQAGYDERAEGWS